MLVVVSTKKRKSERIYHQLGCMYAKRIKGENRLEMKEEKAEKRHYHKCKYCSGLRGDVRMHKKAITKWEEKNDMKFDYDKKTDTLYIATKIGFWKVFKREDELCYLYHRNKYSDNMTLLTAKMGDFHRQADVKPARAIESIIEYIIAHDKAKVIIMDDYRKLPKSTKKQKKYYYAAERKQRRNDTRRIDILFAVLEQNNAGLRAYSIC